MKTRVLLTLGSLSFVLMAISCLCFVVSQFLLIGEEEASRYFKHFFGLLGVIWGSLAMLQFLLVCPNCGNKILLPPWKRTEYDISPNRQMYNGLVYKKWQCGSCGKSLNESK